MREFIFYLVKLNAIS